VSQTPILTPKAQADLDAIWDTIAANNPGAADRMIDAILKRARSLAQFPLTGRARDDIRPGLRSSAVKPYVILFRPADDSIQVLRVLHGARDIPTVMASGDD
jgi:toxin ParE1/3/4